MVIQHHDMNIQHQDTTTGVVGHAYEATFGIKISQKANSQLDAMKEHIGLGATKKRIIEKIIAKAYTRVIIENMGAEGLN